MLINPVVGMRVRYIGEGSCRSGRIGTIVELSGSRPIGDLNLSPVVEVDFETPLNWGIQIWQCYLDCLEPMSSFDIENEQDKQRRQAHAMKWLSRLVTLLRLKKRGWKWLLGGAFVMFILPMLIKACV